MTNNELSEEDIDQLQRLKSRFRPSVVRAASRAAVRVSRAARRGRSAGATVLKKSEAVVVKDLKTIKKKGHRLPRIVIKMPGGAPGTPRVIIPAENRIFFTGTQTSEGILGFSRKDRWLY